MLLKAGGFDTRLRQLEDLDLFVRFAQAGGNLERAVAARNEGQHVRMRRLLAASFALVPRRQIQLSPWWSTPPQ